MNNSSKIPSNYPQKNEKSPRTQEFIDLEDKKNEWRKIVSNAFFTLL